MSIYLEKRRPAENMARFYRIQVTPTLFGQWAVIREWGRIGSKGRKLEEWFFSESDAKEASSKVKDQKIKRGYV